MKRAAFLWWVVALIVVGTGAYLLGARRGGQPATQAALTVRYQCPMHPSYVSDKPGACPICGMKLVPIQAPPQPSGERKLLYYRSPMDPSVRSDKPAQDSMGMDFIPVYEDETQAKASTVPGRANLNLSPERLQVLGIRSGEIHHGPLARVMRTVGRVTVDERRLHHIHTKYDGYVEHLYVDFTGKFVKRGEPLLSIYSPDLVATQQEYLLAYTHRSRWPRAGSPPWPRARSTCWRRRARGCSCGTSGARTSRVSSEPGRSSARSTCTPTSQATWSRRWLSTACA